MPVVTLPDGSTRSVAAGASALDVARAIGPRLADAAIAARINGQITDLSAVLPGDCNVSIITAKADDKDALRIIRHSCAHVMAEAICKLFPETRLVYGPPVENGFYYDIDLARKLTPDDFPAIELEMSRIIEANRPFTRYEMPRDAGMTKLRAEGNPYKLENAERAKGDVLSFYVTGAEAGKHWEDLCMGTHVPSTGKIGAFKLESIAGAFLHGDASKQQLQRVYGTAFPTKRDLDAHLHQIEEARKRDHRKIGQELKLFTIDPMVGSGLVLWKPRGATVRLILENMLRAELVKAGYEPVFTPHIGRVDMYKISGHYPYYEDSQFPVLSEVRDSAYPLLRMLRECREGNKPIDAATERRLVVEAGIPEAKYPWEERDLDYRMAIARQLCVTGEAYLLRPMNCPHHIRIFDSEPRSYRDMPVRLAEFGTVYRHEQSGELTGMARVRGLTQDDAHLFVTPDQLQAEMQGCLKLVKFVLEAIGLREYRARIGLHDPSSGKFINNPAMWARAEQAVTEAAQIAGLSAESAVGEAAFYGPKIDFVVKDCIGREWQLGTVQADYSAPERFGLKYIGSDGRAHSPVMIHRAPFGSMERFCAILIEHFAGAFPTWLAPVQAVVATISERSEAYGREVVSVLKAAGLRVEYDFSPEKIGPKKHAARQQKVPYVLVVGEKEAAQRMINVNPRDSEASSTMSLDALMSKLIEENRPPSTSLGV